MQYSIKLNAVNNPEKSVRAFATVTFGDCFKVTNIAVVEGKENQPFVSMPSFKTKERTEHNEPVYKEKNEYVYGRAAGISDKQPINHVTVCNGRQKERNLCSIQSS